MIYPTKRCISRKTIRFANQNNTFQQTAKTLEFSKKTQKTKKTKDLGNCWVAGDGGVGEGGLR